MSHDEDGVTDEKVKEAKTTQPAVFVKLEEIFHAIEGHGSGGTGGGGTHPPVPVVDGAGHFVAHATWNPATGQYQYVDPVATVITEVSSGGSSASSSGGFSGFSGFESSSTGEPSSKGVDSTGGLPPLETPTPPEETDPFGSGFTGQPLPESAQLDALHTYLALPCPGGIHRTSRIASHELLDPANIGKGAVIWIGGIDAAGNVMQEGRIMLTPGVSLARYDAPAGAVAIGVTCGGGTNSGTAHFRYSNAIA